MITAYKTNYNPQHVIRLIEEWWKKLRNIFIVGAVLKVFGSIPHDLLIVLSFALKTNLASLKTEVDKLDIDKLVPVLVDLRKLSNVVKNEVVKKTV